VEKQKIVVAYIFLVGLPVLGLVGILRAGGSLAAPPAIHGPWEVSADFTSWRGVPCGQWLTDAGQPLMTITQAAAEMSVSLNNPEKTILTGTLTGNTLDAMVPCVAGSAAAGSPNSSYEYPLHSSLHLHAVINGQGTARFLTGSISLDGCVKCVPTHFRAVRPLWEVK